MQFITLSRRDTARFSEAEFLPRIAEEAQQARTLYASGFIRQIWHRGDCPGACLLIEAEDEQAVRSGLSTLPLVAAGMLVIEALVPLQPYGGFAPENVQSRSSAAGMRDGNVRAR